MLYDKRRPRERATVVEGSLDVFQSCGIPTWRSGAAYWYEGYRPGDFSLNGTTINQLNLPSAILSGYYYRPYTAHSGSLRLSYLW